MALVQTSAEMHSSEDHYRKRLCVIFRIGKENCRCENKLYLSKSNNFPDRHKEANLMQEKEGILWCAGALPSRSYRRGSEFCPGQPFHCLQCERRMTFGKKKRKTDLFVL